ncbi:uncharacterized protein LOC116263819 [Nymphaea colorata]|nr:uncharacterized protein LOC116263819 [Nymphaea colorata]
MAFAVRSSLLPLVYGNASVSLRRPGRSLPALLCKSSLRNNLSTSSSVDEQKLILEVKNKLEREYPMLPLGSYGRDDDEMILWFLKDRKFHIEETISKLTKAITWRREFGVSDLSEDTVSEIAKTGKAYVHEFPDVHGRPVLVVIASKHFPAKHDPLQSEKLCVFLIEKIINSLPAGKGEVLGIFDLRGFGPENGDILFLKFLIDVFYYYYPRRLGQVLFVDAPVVFQPIWQLVKPLLRSYASLVRFCSSDTVRREYFTEATIPPNFRG